ncbi:hypothetical protein KFL_000010370 [Klebsormidium nitens]|uniref:Isochorismatase-like domain-containing protein n=1 Tax=Klebsormidium nitens TaxID=105231 RepID=A0A0U9HHJ1_KLENI|nr:hypothetical protein KFL_000010370 [Klebsormidium nitens]|eukprot:GAQ77588.1 hypothetical protein KFL_000010370 [Klebsormidium nitens]
MASRELNALLQSEMPLAFEEYKAGPSRVGLVIVDEVNGFATVGAGNLAPPQQDDQVDRMVEETNRLAKAFTERGWPVLAFLDTHEPGVPEPPYPPHCERGTGEENFVPALEWLENNKACVKVRKDCINGFIGAIRQDGSNAVVDWVRDNKVEHMLVVGICTDICVMDFVLTVLSARNHALLPPLAEVFVYSQGCSTYDLPKQVAVALGRRAIDAHPQETTHYLGQYFMASRGARLVDSVSL